MEAYDSSTCPHNHKRYLINQITFKLFRCLDCGLIGRDDL
jgi:hypothetical protein